MRITKNNIIKLDKLGMWLSGACAIHCSVLPVMLALGVGSGLGWMLSHEFELIFLGISLCIASFSLLEGYFKVHKDFKVIIIALVGFGLLITGHEVSHFSWSILLSTLGGIGILIAHFYNFKLRSRYCKLAAN